MTNSPEPSSRDRLRVVRAASAGFHVHPVATWTGWGFLLFALIAIGYGLWTLYGSGTPVAQIDLTAPVGNPTPAQQHGGPPGTTLGPINLEPGMNPLRAVLHGTFAPVGSTRIRYHIAIVDGANEALLVKRGAIGSWDDEATIVQTTESLGDFRISSLGGHYVRVLVTGSSMDNLREATLEIRGNAVPVDARIPWGFGIAAAVCLIVSHVAGRRSGPPYRIEEPGSRTAA